MQNIKIVNCKIDPCDFYIGRPSNWGNLWSHKDYGLAEFYVSTREEAIDNYYYWLKGMKFQEVHPDRRKWILDNIHLLENQTLGCHCFPRACHGEVLLALANGLEYKLKMANDKPRTTGLLF